MRFITMRLDQQLRGAFRKSNSRAKPREISSILSSGNGASRRSIFELSTPAIPRRLTTDVFFIHGGFGKLTSHSPRRISVVIGTTTDMLRWLSGLEIDTTTQGRILATIPRSTKTTSPRLKLVIINVWRRTKLFPSIGNNAGGILGQGRQCIETVGDQLPENFREFFLPPFGFRLRLVVKLLRKPHWVSNFHHAYNL